MITKLPPVGFKSSRSCIIFFSSAIAESSFCCFLALVAGRKCTISDVICHVWIWHRGEILVHFYGCLKSASFWQKDVLISAFFASQGTLRHSQPAVRISHPVICATCIALLDRAPCQATRSPQDCTVVRYLQGQTIIQR